MFLLQVRLFVCAGFVVWAPWLSSLVRLYGCCGVGSVDYFVCSSEWGGTPVWVWAGCLLRVWVGLYG